MEWLVDFGEQCLSMKKDGEKKRKLAGRGVIEWCPDEECPECGEYGIFYGYDLNYGEFYECASVTFCPSCKSLKPRLNINFAPYEQKRFLPVMKKKLIEDPGLAQSLGLKEGSCPSCGGVTYIFRKDLGAIDFYDNTWETCVNPECDWPGRHKEEYEQV